jgi:hypothetical protein
MSRLQIAGNMASTTLTDTSAGVNQKHWSLTSMRGNFRIATTSDAYASSTIPAFTIDSSARVGLSTSTPFATFSIGGFTSQIPFAISTTTATLASSTLFMIDKAGDVHLGGATPVLSSCGTSPTLDANATDQSGTITVGAGASSCTLIFSQPKLSIPHCNVTSQTGTIAISYTETASALVITNATLGGDLVDYNCFLGH